MSMTVHQDTGEVFPQAAKVYAALVKAQRAAPKALEKLDRNDYANFDYVSADRMILAGREALSAAGLALLPVGQELASAESAPAGKSAHVYVAKLRSLYRLVHESGQFLDLAYDLPVVTKKGTPEDKATFGAMTESLGYVYRGLLSIGRFDGRDMGTVDVNGRDDTDYEPASRRPPSSPRRPPPSSRRPLPSSRPRRRSDPPPPSEDYRGSAAQLADEFIESIRRFDGCEPTRENLAELERIPPAVRDANLPRSEFKRIVDVYNPIKLDLQERLGIRDR